MQDITPILKKVKKHHHGRCHQKGKLRPHESINWAVNPDEDISWKPKAIDASKDPLQTSAPDEWLKEHFEKKNILKKAKREQATKQVR
jgi:hypothetical protein